MRGAQGLLRQAARLHNVGCLPQQPLAAALSAVNSLAGGQGLQHLSASYASLAVNPVQWSKLVLPAVSYPGSQIAGDQAAHFSVSAASGSRDSNDAPSTSSGTSGRQEGQQEQGGRLGNSAGYDAAGLASTSDGPREPGRDVDQQQPGKQTDRDRDDRETSSSSSSGSSSDSDTDDEEYSDADGDEGSEDFRVRVANNDEDLDELIRLRREAEAELDSLESGDKLHRDLAGQEDKEGEEVVDEEYEDDELNEVGYDDDDEDEERLEAAAVRMLMAEQWGSESSGDALMDKISSASKKQQKFMLAQLLKGHDLDELGIEAETDEKRMKALLKRLEDEGLGSFRMKIVDVNRVTKRTTQGGIYRFSCMVAVGNGAGVLGYGSGKAADVNAAINKAHSRALRNLFFVPRYRDATIYGRATSKYGKSKVIVYPRAAGSHAVASSLMADVCKLAGIHNIGVKVHGSRNKRNSVKALFNAFATIDDPQEVAREKGLIVKEIAVGKHHLPGQYDGRVYKYSGVYADVDN